MIALMAKLVHWQALPVRETQKKKGEKNRRSCGSRMTDSCKRSHDFRSCDSYEIELNNESEERKKKRGRKGERSANLSQAPGALCRCKDKNDALCLSRTHNGAVAIGKGKGGGKKKGRRRRGGEGRSDVRL